MTYCVNGLKFSQCLVCTNSSYFREFLLSLVDRGQPFYVDYIFDSEQCAICCVYFTEEE